MKHLVQIVLLILFFNSIPILEIAAQDSISFDSFESNIIRDLAFMEKSDGCDSMQMVILIKNYNTIFQYQLKNKAVHFEKFRKIFDNKFRVMAYKMFGFYYYNSNYHLKIDLRIGCEGMPLREKDYFKLCSYK